MFSLELLQCLLEALYRHLHCAINLATRRILMPAAIKELSSDSIAREVIDTAQRYIYLAGLFLAQEA